MDTTVELCKQSDRGLGAIGRIFIDEISGALAGDLLHLVTRAGFLGEVAEWLKAVTFTGCYAAKPHRRFESFPCPPSIKTITEHTKCAGFFAENLPGPNKL